MKTRFAAKTLLPAIVLAFSFCLTVFASGSFAQTPPLQPQTESIQLNATNFPDETFRLFLMEEYAQGNTYVPVEDISEITLDGRFIAGEITSLEGIRLFTHLETIDISYTAATALDVSGLTQLQTLLCPDNRLQTLQTENCIALRVLDCAKNDLSLLSLQSNTSLFSINCNNNRLLTLDLSGLAALAKVSCGNNEMTQLILRNCVDLENLQIAQNRLAQLELGDTVQLTSRLSTQQIPQTLSTYDGETAVFDLSALVGEKNTARVNILATDMYHYSPETGLLSFSGFDMQTREITVTYQYDTQGPLLSVELSFALVCSPAVSGVALPPTLTLETGELHTITPVFSPADAAYQNGLWHNENPLVANVDTQGKLTALAAGETTLSFTTLDGGFTAACTLTVEDPPGIPVVGITLSHTEIELLPSACIALQHTLLPANAANQQVYWYSENDAVAKVSKQGVVLALSAGETQITVETDDGAFLAHCIVTCTPPSPPSSSINPDPDSEEQNTDSSQPVSSNEETSVPTPPPAPPAPPAPTPTPTPTPTPAATQPQNLTLNHAALTLKPGARTRLSVSSLPAKTKTPLVTWKSSNSTLVSVNTRGEIRAGKNAKNGTALITATAADGSGLRATCSVRVGVPVARVSLRGSRVLQSRKTLTLKATLLPENASDKALFWSSSDETRATVSQSGRVRALAPGRVIIAATPRDGGKPAQYSLTIKPAVRSITLNQKSLTLHAGGSTKLKAKILPTNAIDHSVQWKSSNSAVATVNHNGVVEAAKSAQNGSHAVITATSLNGKKTARFTLYIGTPVQNIKLSTSSLRLVPQQTTTLKTTLFPTNPTNSTVTWRCSNPAVAKIDAMGRVTAISPGRALLTATAQDGAKQAHCRVVVRSAAVN